jgi:5-methylcytosine-specific restriction endonuclease McrA
MKPVDAQIDDMKDKLTSIGWFDTYSLQVKDQYRMTFLNVKNNLMFSTYGQTPMQAYGKALKAVFPRMPRSNKQRVHPKKLIDRIDLQLGLDMLRNDRNWAVRNKFIEYRRLYRLEVFLEKGTNCVECGLEGRYFSVVEDTGGDRHINLYAQAPDGNEVLMTCDHIIPRASGGGDWMSNLQTMCFPCNSRKADKCLLSSSKKVQRRSGIILTSLATSPPIR